MKDDNKNTNKAYEKEVKSTHRIASLLVGGFVAAMVLVALLVVKAPSQMTTILTLGTLGITYCIFQVICIATEGEMPADYGMFKLHVDEDGNITNEKELKKFVNAQLNEGNLELDETAEDDGWQEATDLSSIENLEETTIGLVLNTANNDETIGTILCTFKYAYLEGDDIVIKGNDGVVVCRVYNAINDQACAGIVEALHTHDTK